MADFEEKRTFAQWLKFVKLVEKPTRKKIKFSEVKKAIDYVDLRLDDNFLLKYENPEAFSQKHETYLF